MEGKEKGKEGRTEGKEETKEERIINTEIFVCWGPLMDWNLVVQSRR